MNLMALWLMNYSNKISSSLYELFDDIKTSRFILKLIVVQVIGMATTLLVGQFLDHKYEDLDLTSFKMVLICGLAAPVIEEICFRSWVKKHTLLLSAIIFGLAHTINYKLIEWWMIPLVVIACFSQFAGGDCKWFSADKVRLYVVGYFTLPLE